MDTILQLALIVMILGVIVSGAVDYFKQSRGPTSRNNRGFDLAAGNEQRIQQIVDYIVVERGIPAGKARALAICQQPLREDHPPVSTELESFARTNARLYMGRAYRSENVEERLQIGRRTLEQLVDAAYIHGDKYYWTLWGEALVVLTERESDGTP